MVNADISGADAGKCLDRESGDAPRKPIIKPEVLENVGDELPRTVATRFPEIDRMIKDPSSPVVLELRGISRNRLLTERGGDDVDTHLQLFFEMMAFSGVNDPAAFRVQDVTAADVVAVHELCDWPSEEVHDPHWPAPPETPPGVADGV